MGGRGGSMGGSHGMSGGGGAAKAAAPKAPAQTREQKLLAQIKGNPAAILKMSDQDALDTVKAIEKQSIATDGTQNDTFIQRYLNATGLSNSKPQLLDDSSYEKARMKAHEVSMYHADRERSVKLANAHNQQIQGGDTMFSANGYYGAGIYWAWGSADASAGYGRHQIKSFLNSKAKVITTDKLDSLKQTFRRSHPNTYAMLKAAKRGYGLNNETLYSFIAASNGYNVIQCDRKRSPGTYMVTLDRSALTMSKKKINNAYDGMDNW